MNRVLVIFSHPTLERSRVHATLAARVSPLNGVTFHDLYEAYPDFDIDVVREQSLLLAHDIIVWQHPVYWYSAPALLKQWQDLVLVHGWAYGRSGKNLEGKIIFNAVSTGGGTEGYSATGVHGHSLHEFLLPFERTAGLCRMVYWPPFVVPGTHRLRITDIDYYAWQYEALLSGLVKGELDIAKVQSVRTLNQLVEQPQIKT